MRRIKQGASVCRLRWWETAGAVCVLYAAAVVAVPAQTFTTLYNFSGPDGGNPAAALVQGANGSLYGTTLVGGANSHGTVFKINGNGSLMVLHNFDLTDGAAPYAGLVLASNGNLYGTTIDSENQGGCGFEFGCGTVFKTSPSGRFASLLTFDLTNGAQPYAGLVLATNGSLYGTTVYGGSNGGGTFFSVTPSGTLTTLYNFCSQGGSSCTDGANPYAGLIQGTDGNFYGTTQFGGQAFFMARSSRSPQAAD